MPADGIRDKLFGWLCSHVNSIPLDEAERDAVTTAFAMRNETESTTAHPPGTPRTHQGIDWKLLVPSSSSPCE